MVSTRRIDNCTTQLFPRAYVAGSCYYGQLGLNHNRTDVRWTPLPNTIFLDQRNSKRGDDENFHDTDSLNSDTDDNDSNNSDDHSLDALFAREVFYYVSCGESFTWLMASSGNIWRCGLNQDGQLGMGNNGGHHPSVNTFQLLRQHTYDIVPYGIKCGQYHTMMLAKCAQSGRSVVLGCGRNSSGQCGIKVVATTTTTTGKRSPLYELTPINPQAFNWETIGDIACGSNFSIFQVQSDYNSNGMVNYYYATGSSKVYSQDLGIIGDEQRDEPQQVIFPYGTVKQIGAMRDASIIISNDNELYLSGYGVVGEIPFVFHKVQLSSPVSNIVSGFNSVMIKLQNGTWCGLGDNSYRHLMSTDIAKSIVKPKQVECDFEGEIVHLALGNQHTAFVTSTGALYVIGWNGNHQLGLDGVSEHELIKIDLPLHKPEWNEEIAVECGGYSTIFYVRPKYSIHMRVTQYRNKLHSLATGYTPRFIDVDFLF